MGSPEEASRSGKLEQSGKAETANSVREINPLEPKNDSDEHKVTAIPAEEAWLTTTIPLDGMILHNHTLNSTFIVFPKQTSRHPGCRNQTIRIWHSQ